MITKSPSHYDGKKVGCQSGIWTVRDLKRQQQESRANAMPGLAKAHRARIRAAVRKARGQSNYQLALAYMESHPAFNDPEIVLRAIGLTGPPQSKHVRKTRRAIQQWMAARFKRNKCNLLADTASLDAEYRDSIALP